ncbi:putative hemolysin-type calcium-binding region, partial [Lyngbya aestuarii BL J]
MITVTNTNDNGLGSLRNAIKTAQPGDIIQFDASLVGQTITLTSGQLEIDKNLTIDGQNAPDLIISGNQTNRVFDIKIDANFQSPAVSLKNLIIAEGKAQGTGQDGAGGGIRMASETTLTLENSELRNNVAQFAGGILTGFKSNTTIINSKFDNNDGTLGKSERGGGAIATQSAGSLTVLDSEFTNNKGINGGAINHLLGNLTVENSRFINNSSIPGGTVSDGLGGYYGAGGAIYTDGANASGPNFSPGSQGGIIQINNSLFDGNQGAGQGGGLFLFVYPPDKVIVENSTIQNNTILENLKGEGLGGGLRHGNGELTLSNTTFTGNRALSQGGGLWIGEQSPTTITNSTFSGNRAESEDGNSGLGGAIALSNGTNQTNIINTTIANNYAGFQGGGFWGGGSQTRLKNTIVAYNVANNGGNNWNINHHTGFQFSDDGGNFQSNELNPNDIKITQNVTLTDPLLGSLQNINGVLVHPLQVGSPVIDAGVSVNLTTDQRGQTRPIDGDENGVAKVDSGSYEYQVAAVTLPEISVIQNTTNIADNTGTFDFGTSTVGSVVSKTFTIENNGTADLTLSELTLPTGLTLAGTFPTVIAAGSQGTFDVQLDTNTANTFNGELSFTTNDT